MKIFYSFGKKVGTLVWWILREKSKFGLTIKCNLVDQSVLWCHSWLKWHWKWNSLKKNWKLNTNQRCVEVLRIVRKADICQRSKPLIHSKDFFKFLKKISRSLSFSFFLLKNLNQIEIQRKIWSLRKILFRLS